MEGSATSPEIAQAATQETINQGAEEEATAAPNAINAGDSATLLATATRKEVKRGREGQEVLSATAAIKKVIWLEIALRVTEKTIWSATNAMKLVILPGTARVTTLFILV